MLKGLRKRLSFVSLKTHEDIVNAREQEWRKLVADLRAAVAKCQTEIGNVTSLANQVRTVNTDMRIKQQQVQLEAEDLAQEVKRLQAERDTAEVQVLAFRSIPLWTRKGKTWIRLNPGDNPIMESDPVLTEIAKQSAAELAKELYRRARAGNVDALILIARSAGVPRSEPTEAAP